MNHPLWTVLRLNILDLWRTRRAQSVTLIALTVGFFALFLSLGLRESQQTLILGKARELLTGDAQILANRAATEQELNHFKQVFQPQALSTEVDLHASLRATDGATLVELKAVTESFPLVGQVLLENDSKADFKNLRRGEIWLADELRQSMKLNRQDAVRIGSLTFKITGWINADVGLRRGATGFAPRAYISLDDLQETGLIQPGSQVQYRSTILFSKSQTQPDDLSSVEKLKNRLIDWPEELVIRSPQDAITGVQRGIGYAESYLSLITLLLMLLGFISGFYLLQIHLRSRALTLALSLLFGARPLWLEVGAALQILTLMFAAWILAAGATLVVFASLNPIVQQLTSGAYLFLGAKSYLIAFGLMLMNTLIFALPFAFRFRRLEPDVLLNQSAPSLPMARPREDLLPYSLAMIGYSTVAAWLQQSWLVATVISLTLIGFVALASQGLPAWAAQLGRRSQKTGLNRLAWLGLARPRLLTTLVWVALAWSATLCAVIPDLLAQARHELKSPRERDLPQLFAINVRPEDVEPFKNAVAKEGAELRHPSPLILARLLKINNEPVREGWISRFPVRLTFREKLTTAERIVAGQALPALFNGQGLPGISVEIEFAKRNNLTIGDEVEFEVSGLPLIAQVQNLRTVKWNTFQPNFFMQFAGGVLEEFPKSYIAVIYGLPEKEIFAAQGRLSRLFPSLSLLNLATTIDRLSEIVSKLILPIAAISLTGLGVVLLLVSLLSAHLWQERQDERNLLMWLGASRSQLRSLFTRENIWLAGSALLTGTLIGLGLSTVVVKQVFDRWTLPQEYGLVLLLGLISFFLCSLPIWLGTRGPK
ncbi:MAG: ABC transporter permease [Bdellovibrionales bacterium]